ncbi:DUF721 domain-containing protein [Streptomyces roseoverticillatus]|uniref:DUF721 domain-containing protein n=1 Tax=Streptomyces roseoverticillatus TaxID=66429 RepID=UPI0033D1D1FA
MRLRLPSVRPCPVHRLPYLHWRRGNVVTQQADHAGATASGRGLEGKPDLARIALRQARKDAARRRSAPTRAPRRREPRKRHAQPVALSTVVEEMTREMQRSFGLISPVITQWASLAGPLAHGTTAVAFDPHAGELILRAASPAWLTQTRLLGPALVRHLNERMGDTTVRTVRVLPHQPGTLAATRPAPSRQDHEPPVDSTAMAAAERQRRSLPREPTLNLTPNGPGRPAGDDIRTQALLRARSRPRSVPGQH